MKKAILLVTAIALASYLYLGLPLPSTHSSDPRISYVFARERLGFASCIRVGGESREELLIPLEQSETVSPLQLTISRFESAEVRRVSSELASGEFEVLVPKIMGMEVVEAGQEEWCGASIGSLVVADDVAIVSFTSPSGDIGTHAFHRGALGWRAIERVHWGWW